MSKYRRIFIISNFLSLAGGIFSARLWTLNSVTCRAPRVFMSRFRRPILSYSRNHVSLFACTYPGSVSYITKCFFNSLFGGLTSLCLRPCTQSSALVPPVICSMYFNKLCFKPGTSIARNAMKRSSQTTVISKKRVCSTHDNLYPRKKHP